MGTLALDGNRNPLSIREGSPIGGYYVPTGITANTWNRLMPYDATIDKVDDETADIEDLRRADVTKLGALLAGWRMRILTQGYERTLTIQSLDVSNHYAKLIGGDLKKVPDTFAAVLYPDIVNPFTMTYDTTDTTAMDVGYLIAETESLADANVHTIIRIDPGDIFIYPVKSIDRLCFKFAGSSVPSAFSLSWGEHLVGG